MPSAELIFEDKQLLEDGAIIEMRIWRVPEPVPASSHEFKYSMFYGQPGDVVVLFDNERGKGDHKHVGNAESAYRFESPERLVEDFVSAVCALQGGKDDEQRRSTDPTGPHRRVDRGHGPTLCRCLASSRTRRADAAERRATCRI